VSLAHWPWPDGQRPWPEKKERGREEDDTLTDAQVLIWTAWQGSAHAAGQRLPEGDFTTAHQEHRITSELTHKRSPRRSTAGTIESRRGVEVSGDREAIPERDPALDLLGEEAAGKTVWWRWNRARR
jgi:hypothetical protein